MGNCDSPINIEQEYNEQEIFVYNEPVIIGDGTKNYNELYNKPSINGVILQGNKTSAQLNIIVPTKTSDLTNDSGFITNSVDNLVNYYTKTEVDTLGGELTQTLETYVDTELSDYTKTSDLATVALSGRYNDLINKPDLTNYLETTDVINNVASSDTDKPLSANMGKELNDRIQNLASIGKYLAMWDCTTGLPTTDPVTMPYTYTTGDYYVISNIGATNYMPNGSVYTGAASTIQYTGTLNVGDFFYYDGTVWTLLKNTGKTVYFANIAGDPMDNSNLASEFANYYTKTQVDGKVNFTIDETTYTTVQDTVDMLISEFTSVLETKASVDDVVDKTSVQTITGNKTFNGSIGITTSIFYGSPRPSSDNSIDLGLLARRWKDFYLAGNLTDGTNSITINKIANKDNFVTLTQAEYDALATKDPDTYYFIEEE